MLSLSWQGEIRPNPDEIDEGRFFAMADVEALMGRGILTPLFEREWPMLKQALGRSS